MRRRTGTRPSYRRDPEKQKTPTSRISRWAARPVRSRSARCEPPTLSRSTTSCCASRKKAEHPSPAQRLFDVERGLRVSPDPDLASFIAAQRLAPPGAHVQWTPLAGGVPWDILRDA